MATSSTINAGEEPQGPPLPKWMYRFVNPLMTTVLRSPLHGLLSKQLLVLIFEGRKTGKRYAIPVGYLREGNRLYVFSHSGWARNFVGKAAVAVRLQGVLQRGTATVIDDVAEINNAVQHMIKARGEALAVRMGLARKDATGTMEPHVAPGTTFIRITLQDAH